MLCPAATGTALRYNTTRIPHDPGEAKQGREGSTWPTKETTTKL